MELIRKHHCVSFSRTTYVYDGIYSNFSLSLTTGLSTGSRNQSKPLISFDRMVLSFTSRDRPPENEYVPAASVWKRHLDVASRAHLWRRSCFDHGLGCRGRWGWRGGRAAWPGRSDRAGRRTARPSCRCRTAGTSMAASSSAGMLPRAPPRCRWRCPAASAPRASPRPASTWCPWAPPGASRWSPPAVSAGRTSSAAASPSRRSSRCAPIRARSPR